MEPPPSQTEPQYGAIGLGGAADMLEHLADFLEAVHPMVRKWQALIANSVAAQSRPANEPAEVLEREVCHQLGLTRYVLAVERVQRALRHPFADHC